MRIKSPFIIHQEFLSPLLCEKIVYHMDVTTPDYDINEKPLPSIRHNDKSELIIFERLQPLIPEFEEHFNVEYKGTEKMFFEWYPEGSKGNLVCDGSEYINKKWVRTRERDLTGIIFLSEHNETPSFDSDYEVYGGKLEFPNHGFGFNPERGTMIIFPSTPHFLNATAQVMVGDLFQVRFHIATKTPFLYQPVNFPGNYQTWFKKFM